MSIINQNQRNATRNQSTLDISYKTVFIFDNRFDSADFKNNTAGSLNLLPASLVCRNTAAPAQVIPATVDNLADVIAITGNEEILTLAAAGTLNISICTKGTIDGLNLSLPAGVTLNTVVGTRILRDVLESLGFHIDTSATEHTKPDN